MSLEHVVNLNTAHDVMCCAHPTKTVNIEEGWKLKIVFTACHLCDKCKPNEFLSSFKSVQSMFD